GKKALRSTEITLVSGEMESISFWEKGLSVLPSITNEKINVRHMAVMDITCFFDREKEEIKRKEFVIKEKLYMKNTGIFFLEVFRNTVFIPVIEIEVDSCMGNWGGFGKTTGINIKTNALVENIIDPQIKQTVGEMVTQKKTDVDNETGYPKLVFKEDPKHEEQRESEESSEQPRTGCQVLEVFKEDYSLLEESRDMHIPEENNWFQDE
ncbi:MAG: uncharacterized protein A8A55_3478, partial [Amphiamblys sp. WSBS2006]